MKTLSSKHIEKVREYIFDQCSNLCKQLFIHHFENENYAGVIAALAKYQNKDGGFGHNLEGDFELPDSTPIATSVAFQILTSLNADVDEPLVRRGILYLLCNLQIMRNGWISVPPQVNHFPHASWWHYTPDKDGTDIDKNWGNPSAEIIGYLMQYRSITVSSMIDRLYTHALNYLKNHPGKMEMHELFCFLRFAERMPANDFEEVKLKLSALVMDAVNTNPQSWSQYTAQPLDFVKTPESFLLQLLKLSIDKNLDYWVEVVKSDHVFMPTWTWENYPEDWLKARVEISGRLTIDHLTILMKFGRVKA